MASTDAKSRVNFLELLQAERRYEVNAEALAYLAERGLAAGHGERLATHPVVLADPEAWAAHLRRNLIDSPRAVALATEGALQHPDPAAKARITAGFAALCATETTCEPLNEVLQGFQGNQAELLRVLERLDWPIHNHRSETDLRDMVKKRNISAGTRSEVGRQCRDTFASLKKTCRKQGISFWEYLKDRVAGLNLIPSLAELIRRPATP